EPLAARSLYWHYPHYSNQGGKPGGAIFDGDFKLIEFFEDGKTELYSLREDPGEQNDLAARLKDDVKELYKELGEWRKKVNARIPGPNPDYKPAP
ncbi:MAG: DUF4976 domain-containing protein, partial [Planctomycetia bacterium]|nr:DUF4976 domain-containing protein [Planctomycetia bacterium]